MSYLSDKNEKIKNIDKATAKSFFLSDGYFSDHSVLPLKILPNNLASLELNSIDWTRQNLNVARTSSLDIVVDKDEKGLRKFSLIHPYIYWHIANELIDNYAILKERLFRETNVGSYAVPYFDGTDSATADWRHFEIIDPSISFNDYSYMVSADIYNFYESIYTHSISWAMHGKDVAKNNVRNLTFLGNRLDKLFQNSHDGQTNGIPTGNVLSDIAAEIILKDIDELIGQSIRDLDIKAFRYRDDYRFLCKTKNDARKILDSLALTLTIEYGLTLNQTKTQIQSIEDYRSNVAHSGLKVKLPLIRNTRETHLDWQDIFKYIEKCILQSGGTKGGFNRQIEELMRILRGNLTNLIADDSDDWVDAIYSALTDCIDSGVSTTGHTFFLLDFVLSNVKSETIRRRLLNNLNDRFISSHNEGNKLWTYAVLLHLDTSKANSFANAQNTALFKMMSNTSNPQIDQFISRDPIPAIDKQTLTPLAIVGTSLIRSISTISLIDYIFSEIDEVEFDDASKNFYGDR